MADESWYRRKTWSSNDEAEFFRRLARCRTGFHKAQYCRIQAYELQCEGEYHAALRLLELLTREWPDDAQQRQVFEQKAICLERVGQPDAAITAYRAVFDVQRKKPGCITRAHEGFGWLAATVPYPRLFDEALSVLDEFQYSHDFPAGEFRSAAVRALIWDAKGDRKKASEYANAALAANLKHYSGFANHPRLGLVEKIEPGLRSKIEEIAGHGG